MNKNIQTKAGVAIIAGIALASLLVFGAAKNAAAQSKKDLCKKYAKSGWAYQCCMTHNSSNFEECFNGGSADRKKGQSGASKPQPSAPQSSGLFKTSQGEAAYQAYLSCLQKNDNDVDICDSDPAYNRIRNDAQKKYDKCQSACGEDTQCAGCDKYKKMLGEISQAKADAGFVTGKPPKHSKPVLPHDFTVEFQSLAGGLSRPFDEIYWRARKFSPKTVTDNAGNPVAADDILKKGWKNASPVIKTKVPVENLQKGDIVSTDMPAGLPLRGMVFAAYEPVKYADAEITIYDGKTTPEILRETSGPLGNDDVQTPDPKKYDIGFYFKIGTVVREKDEEIHPFAGAMFEIFPWVLFDTPEQLRNLRVLRWEKDQQKWNELPLSRREGCDYRGCEVYAKSPGTSYFAVVAEKQTSQLASLAKVLLWIWIAGVIILAAFFLIVWLARRKKRNRSKKSRK